MDPPDKRGVGYDIGVLSMIPLYCAVCFCLFVER